MCSKFIYITCIFAVLSCTSATIVQKCKSGPEAIKVEIAGCDKEPCNLPLGSTAIMDMTFKATKDSATLVPKVRATVGLITITYPLPGDLQNGCLGITNGECPLKKDSIVDYRLKMPINGFPKIGVTLEFSLLGDGGEVFQCFKVDCKVV